MVLNKNILFVLSTIFLISLVYAQVNSQQQITKGYTITYPNLNVLKTNEAYTFHFHIFNSSNGAPLLTGFSGVLHIYNSSGKHILEVIPTRDSNGIDYRYYIGGGNFSNPGIYSYIIQFNSSSEGGANAIAFEVTPSGTILTEAEAIVTSIFFIFSVLILFTCVYISYKIPFSSPKEQMNTTSMLKQYRVLKIGMIAISYFILVFVIALSMNVTNNYLYLTGFYSFFKYFYTILIAMAYPIAIVTMFLSLIIFIYDYIWIKKLSKFVGGNNFGAE